MISPTRTLDEIRVEVERLAAKIGAEPWMLPTYGQSEQTGRPHIEEDGTLYYFVVAERGGEFLRWNTESLDELMFVIFCDVVSQFGLKERRQPRLRDKDQRRDSFQQRVELMTLLSATWAQRLEVFQRRLLALFPFDDCVNLRLGLARSLQDQGRSYEEAWQISRQKYPEPKRGTLQDADRLYAELRMPHKAN